MRNADGLGRYWPAVEIVFNRLDNASRGPSDDWSRVESKENEMDRTALKLGEDLSDSSPRYGREAEIACQEAD
jgi:hypothetical protein